MKKGDVIIFPTDTVYGMATKLYDKVGLEKIYQIKSREHEKYIPILIGNIITLNHIANYDYKTLNVMTSFWPGPLTIVLKTKEEFFNKTGEETIGVRIPNHYLALDLINEFGPLRTTSVNISGKTPLNTYDDVLKQFGNVVDKVYGEHTNDYLGIVSTIVEATNGEIKLIREGAIPFSNILEVYNK